MNPHSRSPVSWRLPGLNQLYSRHSPARGKPPACPFSQSTGTVPPKHKSYHGREVRVLPGSRINAGVSNPEISLAAIGFCKADAADALADAADTKARPRVFEKGTVCCAEQCGGQRPNISPAEIIFRGVRFRFGDFDQAEKQSRVNHLRSDNFQHFDAPRGDSLS